MIGTAEAVVEREDGASARARKVTEIRLVNTDPRKIQISFDLLWPRDPASPSLRRTAKAWSIAIPSGGHYDMCKMMGIDVSTAMRILKESVDYKRVTAAGRVVGIEWPPEEETNLPPPQLVPSEVERPKPIKPGSREELESKPDGVLEIIREHYGVAIGPRAQVIDAILEKVERAKQEAVYAAPIDVAPVGKAEALVVEERAPVELAEVEFDQTEPNMNWSLDRLKDHALQMGIAVSKYRTKPLLLRAIKGEV